ncbi:hypothetical protein PP427_gp291 [Salmonella phage KM16]|nr:hypothetical protein PP427_gp291 [Salmonella phage KM16]
MLLRSYTNKENKMKLQSIKLCSEYHDGDIVCPVM